MELRPITDPEKVLNEEIRRRAKNGSKTAVTKHFVAVEEGVEAAFVALDIFPDPEEHLVLYELVVPKALRCRGIGSRVLAIVEKLAREWKYAKVLLRPKPLDATWSSERLEDWYSKRGYKPVSRDRTDVWTKAVVKVGHPFA
jgi:GNAT superfamily N-acetyltransferase